MGKLLQSLINAGWAMIAGTFGAIKTGNLDYLLWSAAGLVVVMMLFSIMSWLRFHYRLEGDQLMVKRGILQREQLSIEFARVQKTRVLEPFYLRPFGLALLEVDTAGSAKEEVTLGGIDINLARTLRDNIVSRQQPDEDEEQAHNTEGPAVARDTAVLSRSNKQIALYGLTHNGMFWIVAAVAAVVSQADQSDSWGLFKHVARLFDYKIWSSLQLSLIIFGLLMILPLASIMASFWRHYGYTLYRVGETWRRHSGLISKNDESIKQHKIQSLIWQQNFVARGLGLVNMRLKQTSAGVAASAQGQLNKRKPAFLVPALLPHEAEQLTSQLLPGAQCIDTDFSSVDRKYISRTLLFRWSLPATVITIVTTELLDWRAAFLWPVIMMVGWLLLRQFWRRLGYAIDGQYGVVRTGFIGSKTTVFPLFKVQRVDIRQSPGQRRHKLAHLTIHLASHSLTLPWIALEDAEFYRNVALYHVETSEENWF